jgi:hypothetical protein
VEKKPETKAVPANKKIEVPSVFGGGKKSNDKPAPKAAPAKKIDAANVFGKKEEPKPAPVRSAIGAGKKIDPSAVFGKKPEPPKKAAPALPKKEDPKFKKPDDDFKKSLEALLSGPPKPMRKKTTIVQPPAKKFTSNNTDMFADDVAGPDAMFNGQTKSRARTDTVWKSNLGGIDAVGFADSKP